VPHSGFGLGKEGLLIRAAAIALLLLWVLGMVTGHTMGGFIHALLVLAILLGLVSLVRGNA